MDKPRPTMHDIARLAGVHQTTVSRALRNDHRLPEATRKRIQALAEKLEYRANPLVSALVVARRSRHPPTFEPTLAYIQREDRDPQAASGARSRQRYLQGAREEAQRQGFKIEEFVVGKAGLSEERLNTVLLTRNIHGLVLAPLPEAHGHFTLAWERFCTVVIEYTFTDPSFDRVVHDSYGGMRQIMAECRRRGLRRVGLAMTMLGHERTERINGGAYWIEQKSDEFFAPVAPLFLQHWHAGQFGEWMRRQRPEVVVTSNDLIDMARQWSADHGIVIGRDLSLINMNAHPESGVSGIFQDPVGIGSTAARMVIEKIMHNDWGIPSRRQTVLTPGEWVEGATLRAPIEAAVAAVPAG